MHTWSKHGSRISLSLQQWCKHLTETTNMDGTNLISLKLAMTAILRCKTVNVSLQGMFIGDIIPAALWYVTCYLKITSLFGRPYYRSRLWYNVSSVCDVLYCGKTVRRSEKLSEGVNRKPGSKSWFFESPPYFYFRFDLYGHWDCHFMGPQTREGWVKSAIFYL